MIRSWCQQMTYMKPPKLCGMLYQLARSPLTQRNPEKSKDRFGLVWSAISAQAQFLLLCHALSYSAPSWGGGHHEKVGGHSKKISGASLRNLCPLTFEMLPVPLTGNSQCLSPIHFICTARTLQPQQKAFYTETQHYTMITCAHCHPDARIAHF